MPDEIEVKLIQQAARGDRQAFASYSNVISNRSTTTLFPFPMIRQLPRTSRRRLSLKLIPTFPVSSPPGIFDPGSFV
jgi:hypothetical protein